MKTAGYRCEGYTVISCKDVNITLVKITSSKHVSVSDGLKFISISLANTG